MPLSTLCIHQTVFFLKSICFVQHFLGDRGLRVHMAIFDRFPFLVRSELWEPVQKVPLSPTQTQVPFLSSLLHHCDPIIKHRLIFLGFLLSSCISRNRRSLCSLLTWPLTKPCVLTLLIFYEVLYVLCGHWLLVTSVSFCSSLCAPCSASFSTLLLLHLPVSTPVNTV